MCGCNYLITWLYAEQDNNESFYPSVGGNTSSPEYQKVYWRCVYTFFRSALLTQTVSEIKYLFFTNVSYIPTNIDGVNIKSFFHETGVEVKQLKLTNQTPKDWYGAWRNQFYLFDILRWLNDHYIGNFLILDSDIFITGDLLPIFQDIQKKQVITYDCGYSDDVSINGISIKQMRLVYSEFKKSEDKMLRYKGGELIGVTSMLIPNILDCFYELWNFNYRLYEKNKIKLNEEAHFLSIIYHYLGFDESIANRYIKRMWTTVRCDNIRKGDEKLLLWHLPAEKKYLFKEMFYYLQRTITREEYLKKLKRRSHIPGSKWIREVRKFSIRLQEKLLEIYLIKLHDRTKENDRGRI